MRVDTHITAITGLQHNNTPKFELIAHGFDAAAAAVSSLQPAELRLYPHGPGRSLESIDRHCYI